MKYMLLLKADEASESGAVPDSEAIANMGRYNDELIKAGVLLAGEGLHSSADGARVRFSGGDRSVVDGPFAETTELLAGFWILEVASKEEAVEWARRVPLTSGEVEVRQVFTVDEFDQDDEYVQKERQWREEHGEVRTA
ncbi:YciI family protein [Naasia sp. SYSU D00948]|uniref:YciI family protein n=1 Tax=Naasia sp. SYSU D00948 TaxID=2817379 RepID=UPI001B303CC4|nr:YciI family protein [Naasia sp. SYSU D00948]